MSSFNHFLFTALITTALGCSAPDEGSASSAEALLRMEAPETLRELLVAAGRPERVVTQPLATWHGQRGEYYLRAVQTPHVDATCTFITTTDRGWAFVHACDGSVAVADVRRGTPDVDDLADFRVALRSRFASSLHTANVATKVALKVAETETGRHLLTSLDRLLANVPDFVDDVVAVPTTSTAGRNLGQLAGEVPEVHLQAARSGGATPSVAVALEHAVAVKSGATIDAFVTTLPKRRVWILDVNASPDTLEGGLRDALIVTRPEGAVILSDNLSGATASFANGGAQRVLVSDTDPTGAFAETRLDLSGDIVALVKRLGITEVVVPYLDVTTVPALKATLALLESGVSVSVGAINLSKDILLGVARKVAPTVASTMDTLLEQETFRVGRSRCRCGW
jgi:hypothetical protein